ncbi:SDR family oxidoreductase [Patulibacter sp.]|uniref:SDR family oxidoreductase n=1 Tax=Patulibacter sp. TaxID=1912859 RepID=UPI00271CA2B0|nr:SDR family oxidoreductase [Patulibacter sp.]MDO9407692.1 SDR family oxidoreductase [Patulibacter sp.]
MTDQRILITGAASGLGLALATRYARDGRRVLLTDLDQGALDAAVETIAAGAGAGVRERLATRVLDVRDDGDWEAARDWVTDAWGGLDVLVNNAGVATGGRFEHLPIEDWDWILQINLMGVVRGCRTFVPVMRAQGSGHLVNIASAAGLLNPPVMASYNVVKAGVVSLSETLRHELEPAGITTSVVCPTFFKTGLAGSFRTPDEAVRRTMEKLVTQSDVPADVIAGRIQKGVEAGRFLILTDREGAVAWAVKRFVPPLFRREARKGAARLLASIARSEREAAAGSPQPTAKV